MPQKDYVNLGFFHATSLNNPALLFEGTGNKLRHVKIHSVEDAVKDKIHALIKESRNERVRSFGLG